MSADRHICTQQCLTARSVRIRHEVSRKIDRHIEFDSRRKFAGCPPTMTLQEGIDLLNDTGGECPVCESTMTLHDWPARHPSQFSFDRIDDNDTHHVGNVRVTCLRCNIAKADQMYKPVHGPYMREYDRYRNIYIEYVSCNPLIIDRVYQSDLRRYLAYLHNKVYGDRRPNGWVRPAETPSKHPPVYTPSRFSDEFEYTWT